MSNLEPIYLLHHLQVFRGQTLRRIVWVSLLILCLLTFILVSEDLLLNAETLISATIQTSPWVVVGGRVRRILWMDGTSPGSGSLNWFWNTLNEGSNVRSSLHEILSTVSPHNSATTCTTSEEDSSLLCTLDFFHRNLWEYPETRSFVWTVLFSGWLRWVVSFFWLTLEAWYGWWGMDQEKESLGSEWGLS